MNKLMTPVDISTAPIASKSILEEVKKRFGMIPNIMGNLANNAEALKAYVVLGDIFEASGLTALEQQIVAISVSRENDCTYCVAAHSAISAMSKLDGNVIQQLRAGEKLQDTKLEALRTFTKCVVSAKGLVDQSDTADFLAVGYTKESVLAVLIGVSLKILANYTNHLANTDLDEAFKAFTWTR
jgi:uncharacterized peroxidase-related enzyme